MRWINPLVKGEHGRWCETKTQFASLVGGKAITILHDGPSSPQNSRVTFTVLWQETMPMHYNPAADDGQTLKILAGIAVAAVAVGAVVLAASAKEEASQQKAKADMAMAQAAEAQSEAARAECAAQKAEAAETELLKERAEMLERERVERAAGDQLLQERAEMLQREKEERANGAKLLRQFKKQVGPQHPNIVVPSDCAVSVPHHVVTVPL
eukprot:COSAG02_NODE_4694_length_5086_cov_7.269045_2_plen_211_part_00